MALAPVHREALDRLGRPSGGPMFDPTLGPLCVDPLRDLVGVADMDLREYAQSRGWSDEDVGRVIGAIALYYTLTASGVLERDPYAQWGE